MNLKRPCLLVLFISAGVAALGYAGTQMVPVVMRHFHIACENYNGLGEMICFIALMVVGLIFSLLSLLWCLGSLIAAILRYVHKHQPEHPNWSDLK